MESAAQLARVDKSPVSVIGVDIIVTGNIEASADLQIEGRVNGDVRCATLVLGEKSAIVGSIHADRVRVLGSVEGSIEAKDLAVEAKGRVVGDVLYERLKVASGGVMEGTLKCKAIAELAMPERKTAETSRLTLVEQTAAENLEHIYIE